MNVYSIYVAYNFYGIYYILIIDRLPRVHL